MPLVGPWTDSTGTGYTYPAAYLMVTERVDTARQTVLIDITIWASSGLRNHAPVWQRTVAPNSSQVAAVCSLIDNRAETALLTRAEFGAMSTTA